MNTNFIRSKSPEEIRYKLYDSLSDRIKPAGRDTGFVLPLSYNIIKPQGANIEMYSKTGKGAESIIHLSASDRS